MQSLNPIVYSPAETRAAYSTTPGNRVVRYTLSDSFFSRFSKTHFDQDTTRHVSRINVYNYNDVQLILRDGSSVPAQLIDWNTRIDYPKYGMRFRVKELPDGKFEFDGSKVIVRPRSRFSVNGLLFLGVMKAANLDTDHGYREIHRAAISGDPAQMQSIIDAKVLTERRYDIDVRDNLDQTALVLAFNYACEREKGKPGKYCQIVRMLLSAGASADMPNISFNQPIVENVCGVLGDIDTLKVLVEKGVNVTNRTFKVHNWTPLHFAANSNRDEIIKHLISIGHAIDPVDQLGMTPLAYACNDQSIKSIQALLELGADPDKIKPETRKNLDRSVLQLLDAKNVAADSTAPKASGLTAVKQTLGIGSAQVTPITTVNN